MSHGDAVDEAGRARTLVSVLEVEGSRQRNAIETRHELVQLDVGRGGSDRHATDIIGKLDLERESHRDGGKSFVVGEVVGWLGLREGLVVVWERERKSGCLRRGVAFVPLVVHRGKFLSLNPPKVRENCWTPIASVLRCCSAVALSGIVGCCWILVAVSRSVMPHRSVRAAGGSGRTLAPIREMFRPEKNARRRCAMSLLPLFFSLTLLSSSASLRHVAPAA